MSQVVPQQESLCGRTTEVSDIRALCSALILAHRAYLTAIHDRATALVEHEQRTAGASSSANAAAPASLPLRSSHAKGTSGARLLTRTPRNREECAMRVLERLACVRHELNRAEQALHFREQHPCEAHSETEAWLLCLRRGRPAKAVSERTAPRSSPPPLTLNDASAPSAITGAKVTTRTSSTGSAAGPESEGGVVHPDAFSSESAERKTTPCATVASSTTTQTTPPRSTQSMGDGVSSLAHQRRHTRRPSSVNLPEFASITSTLTEVSADAASRGGSHGRSVRRDGRRAVRSGDDHEGVDEVDTGVDEEGHSGGDDSDANDSAPADGVHGGEAGQTDSSTDTHPPGRRRTSSTTHRDAEEPVDALVADGEGWVMRTEEIGRTGQSTNAPLGQPHRTSEPLPAQDVIGALAALARGDYSRNSSYATTHKGHPLQQGISRSAAEAVDRSSIARGSSDRAPSPCGARLPASSLGPTVALTQSLPSSPTGLEAHSLSTPSLQAPREEISTDHDKNTTRPHSEPRNTSTRLRTRTPAGHSTPTAASDAPPPVLRASAVAAAGPATSAGTGTVRVGSGPAPRGEAGSLMTTTSTAFMTPLTAALPRRLDRTHDTTLNTTTGKSGGTPNDSACLPVLSVFEQRRIRSLLGGVATDIAAIAILMDELAYLAISVEHEPESTVMGEAVTPATGSVDGRTVEAKTQTGATARHRHRSAKRKAKKIVPKTDDADQAERHAAKDVQASADPPRTSSRLSRLRGDDRDTPLSSQGLLTGEARKGTNTQCASSAPTSANVPSPSSSSAHARHHGADSLMTSPNVTHMTFPSLSQVPPPSPATGPSAPIATRPSSSGYSPQGLPGSDAPSLGSGNMRGTALCSTSPTESVPTSPSAPLPSGGSNSGAGTGSILYRSPLTANRSLLAPVTANANSGGDPGDGARPVASPPLSSPPLSTNTNSTTITGATNLDRVPSAVSFLDPEGNAAEAANCARAGAVGVTVCSRGSTRHSRGGSSEDGIVSAGVVGGLVSVSDNGTQRYPAPTPLQSSRGLPDNRRAQASPLMPPPSQPHKEVGSPSGALTGLGAMVNSSVSAGASRRSLGGSGGVDDITSSFASQYESLDAAHNVAAAAAAAVATSAPGQTHPCALSASDLTGSSTRVTSPTASFPRLTRGVAVGGGTSSDTSGTGTGGGGDRAGAASSRTASRTASMIRRPRKLEVTNSNTKDIAPLVHHYRVISQGGASTHSIMSGGGNGLVSMQPSSSSFRGGGGALAAPPMFRTPSLDSLTADSEMVNLHSPTGPSGQPPGHPPHRHIASFSMSLLGSPRVESERAGVVLSGGSAPAHVGAGGRTHVAVPTTTNAPSAVALEHGVGSSTGAQKAGTNAVGWPAGGVGVPSMHLSGASSCEGSQGQASVGAPPFILRGTNSSFYTTRALTQSAQPTVNSNIAGSHCRMCSNESTEMRAGGSGGSFRSRSGCASPISYMLRDGDGFGGGRALSTSPLPSAADAGAGEGKGGAYAGPPSSAERALRSDHDSLGDPLSSEHSRAVLRENFQNNDTMEDSKGPPPPPPAMMTAAPHSEKDNQFMGSFLGDEQSAEHLRRRLSQSRDTSPSGTASIVSVPAASELLMTLRPGEKHRVEVPHPQTMPHTTTASATTSVTDSASPPDQTYEVDLDQVTQFLHCLHIIESIDFTDEELEMAGLVYCIPGVRQVPVGASSGPTQPVNNLHQDGDADSRDTNNWLLSVVPGSGLERVRACDIKKYAELVKLKIQDIEATTGLRLLTR